jgi:SnoaL-like domain
MSVNSRQPTLSGEEEDHMSVSQAAELQGCLDRQAILDLIYRYSDAVTRADFEQMATVFAPDAVWESPLLELRFENARSFIDFQTEGSARLDVLVQTPHSPVIALLDADGRPQRQQSTSSSEERRAMKARMGKREARSTSISAAFITTSSPRRTVGGSSPTGSSSHF